MINKMSEFNVVDWRLGSNFEVIIPKYIGDSELVNISMSLESIELTLKNKGARIAIDEPEMNSSVIKMVCENPEFFSVQSDHLQNVVEDVFIFEREYADLAKKKKDFFGNNLFPGKFVGEANYYIFVTPKTGIDLFVAAKNVAFFESKTNPS